LHDCHVTDDLVWVASYADRSQLLECDGEADHAFADIDLERLKFFALVPRAAASDAHDEVQHVFKQTADTKLIFFRRRQSEIGLATGEVSPWQTLHVLGFKKTVRFDDGQERSVKTYLYVLPSGSTLLTDDFAAL
jgi:hypothetical protein